MKKNKVIYAILVLLFLFLMIMYDGWQTEMLFLVVVFLPIVFGVVAFYYSRKIQIYFDEIEEYCQRDNHIKKYIMVKNDTPFAIPRLELRVCIEDCMGQKIHRTLVLNSESLTIRNFAMEMAFEHYGMMTIRLEKMCVYDYLGIFSFKKKPKLETIIYVFPDYSEKVYISEGTPSQEGKNPEIQYGKKGTDRSEVMENDEYHEGDDIRNIHWKLSSKSDTLIVKHFGDPKEENINIYVDLKVNKNYRYDCCDGILSALYATVHACEQSGFPYKIWGCSGNELIAMNLRNVMTGITESNNLSNSYQSIGQIRKHGGTGICITTAQIDTDRIDQSLNCIDYYWQKDKQGTYEIIGDTVLKVAVEPKENQKKEFFIKDYNDQIRPHQKINYHQHSDKYLPLQAVIALLASLIAVLSIYDVIYIYHSGIMQAMYAIMFVIMHYIIYYFTMDMEESVGRVRWRTILILCGYAAVILIAGPGNLIEGIRSVIDLFQETLVAKGNYYGFLEFQDSYIDWLLLLVAYAVVDVIFNFCADFVLGIHLLVVIPLLSICMIVGSMPPVSITYMAAVYLPLILVVHHSIRHGRTRSRKYLSDDYVYTGNVAVSTGVFTVIAAVAVSVLATVFVRFGGYETPDWIRKGKTAITRLMDGESWQDLFSVEGFGTISSEKNANGELDDTKKVEYTGETVMEVIVSGDIGEGFYIKEYAGTHYSDQAWTERTQTELEEEEEYMSNMFKQVGYPEIWGGFNENDPYGVADFRQFFSFVQALEQYNDMIRVWSKPVREYNMVITTEEEPLSGIPQPYCSQLMNSNPVWGDGYMFGLLDEERNGTTFEYVGLNAEGYPNRHVIEEQYGEYPYVEKDLRTAEMTRRRVALEEYYSLWIQDNYLTVVPELQDEMEQFKDVTATYGSKQYQLVAGDKQYREIGYEPYVQYVRKFFKDEGYVYNLNITRKNSNNDFILDFMKRKTGYCIHYASTAVMIFRTMGIPARYAEGYYVNVNHQTGPGPGGTRYLVPDSAAHAWVEIYCEGAGWLPVEVTPSYDNYVIKPDTVVETTQPQEPMTTVQNARPQQPETTTSAPKETTTRAKQNVKAEKKASTKKLSDYWEILVPAAVVLMALIRYQWKTESLRKRLSNSKKEERMKAMDAYFVTITRNCYKGWKDYETNEQKAQYLAEECGDFGIAEAKIYKSLKTLDKIRYAPDGSVLDEELNELHEFLEAYGKIGYEHCKVHEKFAYKYIKCLYLKDK